MVEIEEMLEIDLMILHWFIFELSLGVNSVRDLFGVFLKNRDSNVKVGEAVTTTTILPFVRSSVYFLLISM
jgi:hypothetical protein